MTEETKIKPCPLCDEEPTFRKSEMYAGIRSPSVISCRSCDFYLARVGPDSDYRVVMAWNRRLVEDGLRRSLNLHFMVSQSMPGLREAQTILRVILDQVDYTAGNCSPVEMIAAILPKELIQKARAQLQANEEREA